MPRIETVPPQSAGPELAEAYRVVREAGFPAVPTVFQLASLRPDLARVVADAYRGMFSAGRLPRETKEGIATWVSALNECPYCVDAHSLGLQAAGASDAQVAAARSGDLDALAADRPTRLFLDVAEKITRGAFRVTDEDVAAVRDAGWDDEQILEAVFVVAAFNLVNRLVSTLGLDSDDMRADVERIAEAMRAEGG